MSSAKLLFKARPTSAQLADRLRPPPSDGLELYLDVRDLSGDDWLDRIRAEVVSANAPEGLVQVVEGPVNAFDRPYFDVTADTAASRLLIDRLIECGVALGAAAANLHLVAPRDSAANFDDDLKANTLEAARPLLRYYVERCDDAGLTPLVENMPPVLRMRQGAYVYSAIGVEADEFCTLVGEFPSLRVTVDLSHAQLYVNALRSPTEPVPPGVGELLTFLRRRDAHSTLEDYVTALRPWIANVHVSNASGLLGEGAPYYAGDADLDAVVAPLLATARFVVTETLEADPNRAIHMREVQSAIRALEQRARSQRIGLPDGDQGGGQSASRVDPSSGGTA